MSERDPFDSAWRALWPQADRAGGRDDATSAAGTSRGELPARPARRQPPAPMTRWISPTPLTALVTPGPAPAPPLVAATPPAPDAPAARGPAFKALDESIPLLTEVVELPAADATGWPGTLDEVDWSRLALQVREQVLDDLLRQPERFIDEPLRERVHRVIERGTKALAIEIRASVEESVREAIAHAVAEELTRVQAEILYRGHPTRVPDPHDPN